MPRIDTPGFLLEMNIGGFRPGYPVIGKTYDYQHLKAAKVRGKLESFDTETLNLTFRREDNTVDTVHFREVTSIRTHEASRS
jgi:hypothetical protein